MTEPANDRYRGWKAELAGKPRGLAKNEISAGFWSFKARGGTRTPVATWVDPDDGVLVYSVDGGDPEAADPDFAELIFAKARAETQGAYDKRMATGMWPDEVRAPQPEPKAAPVADTIALNPEASHLDQRNDTETPEHEALLTQIKMLDAEAMAWFAQIGKVITNQADADKAANYSVEAGKLHARAAAAKKAVKDPVFDELERLEALWKPVIGAGASLKSWGATINKDWLLAERERIKAEEKAAREAGKPAKAAPVGAGTSGRKQHLREATVLRVDDEDAMFKHIASLPDFRTNSVVLGVVRQSAKMKLEAGVEVPGCHLHVETSVSN